MVNIIFLNIDITITPINIMEKIKIPEKTNTKDLTKKYFDYY